MLGDNFRQDCGFSGSTCCGSLPTRAQDCLTISRLWAGPVEGFLRHRAWAAPLLPARLLVKESKLLDGITGLSGQVRVIGRLDLLC